MCQGKIRRRTKGTHLTTGSITENRINVAMEGPVLDWLRYEARYFGITVPVVIRQKLRRAWEELPQDWKERLRK